MNDGNEENPAKNLNNKKKPPPEAQKRVNNVLNKVREKYFVAPPPKNQFNSCECQPLNCPRENVNPFVPPQPRPRPILKKNAFRNRVTQNVCPPPRPCYCCPKASQGPKNNKRKGSRSPGSKNIKRHSVAPKGNFNPGKYPEENYDGDFGEKSGPRNTFHTNKRQGNPKGPPQQNYANQEQGSRRCRFSDNIEQCCYCPADKLSKGSDKNGNNKNTYHVAGYDIKVINYDDVDNKKDNDKTNASDNGKNDDYCCCEHGVPFESCCTPSPEKPTIIVNNTDLCECEDKWAEVERWKDDAKRRDECHKRLQAQKERQEELRKRHEKEEAEQRYQESLLRHKEEEQRRKTEAHRWRKEQRQMEERRLRQEEERWLEDLCDRQEERKFIKELEEKRTQRRWHEQQMRPRPTKGLVIPELEELRRALAPVPQGPHEIFEYFTLEPQDPPPPQDKGANQDLLMALTGKCGKQNGIHVKLSDCQRKRAILALKSGPPQTVGNKTFNIITGGGTRNKNCDVISSDVQNVMKKVQEITNPYLRFQQTKPYWANFQTNFSSTYGMGGPYYCG